MVHAVAPGVNIDVAVVLASLPNQKLVAAVITAVQGKHVARGMLLGELSNSDTHQCQKPSANIACQEAGIEEKLSKSSHAPTKDTYHEELEPDNTQPITKHECKTILPACLRVDDSFNMARDRYAKHPRPSLETFCSRCIDHTDQLLEGLRPSTAQRLQRQAVSDKLCERLEQIHGVVKVMPAGSFAKGTDLHNVSDVDIVVLFKHYTPDKHVRYLEKVEAHVIELDPYVEKRRFYGDRLNDDTKCNQMFETYLHGKCDGIDFDIVVSGKPPTESKGCISTDSWARWNPSWNYLIVEFVRSMPTAVKDAVRLAKWWRNVLDKTWDPSSKPFSFFLELLTIYAWQCKGGSTATEIFKQFLVLLSDKTVYVHWEENLLPDELHVGDTCTIHSLTSQAGLAINGSTCEVMGRDARKNRFKVRLCECDPYSLWKLIRGDNLTRCVKSLYQANQVVVLDPVHQRFNIAAKLQNWQTIRCMAERTLAHWSVIANEVPASTPVGKRLPVSSIFFSHDTISWRLVNGLLLQDMLIQLLDGRMVVEDFGPLPVHYHGDRWYSMGNRRLALFVALAHLRKAEVYVDIAERSQEEAIEWGWPTKFTNLLNGEFVQIRETGELLRHPCAQLGLMQVKVGQHWSRHHSRARDACHRRRRASHKIYGNRQRIRTSVASYCQGMPCSSSEEDGVSSQAVQQSAKHPPPRLPPPLLKSPPAPPAPRWLGTPPLASPPRPRGPPHRTTVSSLSSVVGDLGDHRQLHRNRH